jgi:hypothetical protein
VALADASEQCGTCGRDFAADISGDRLGHGLAVIQSLGSGDEVNAKLVILQWSEGFGLHAIPGNCCQVAFLNNFS